MTVAGLDRHQNGVSARPPKRTQFERIDIDGRSTVLYTLSTPHWMILNSLTTPQQGVKGSLSVREGQFWKRKSSLRNETWSFRTYILAQRYTTILRQGLVDNEVIWGRNGTFCGHLRAQPWKDWTGNISSIVRHFLLPLAGSTFFLPYLQWQTHSCL